MHTIILCLGPYAKTKKQPSREIEKIEILFECKADCAMDVSITVLCLKGEVKVFM